MRRTDVTLAVIISTTLTLAVHAMPASAFGTYNSPGILGQQAEHERITRVLGNEGFEPRTLDLLAGTSGKLGAVGAPDDALDSSAIPGKGLGPGEKHCDNGDFLDITGYPQSRDAAERQLRICFGYYEQLLDRAVSAAGRIVDDAGVVNAKEAAASSCSFPFSLSKSDATAKCEVLNRLGRALHLSEDFWSHTNWADNADPNQPISIQNPPGLGRTDIPAGLRYPGAGSAGVPQGLISGCDDSVPVLGAIECKGRVTHSVLAKDNGYINPGSCAGASPTSKYARGQVTASGGQQNFSLAVCGAMNQARQTWNDLAGAIRSTYGSDRGDLIVAAILGDKVPAASVALEESESPSASPSESASASPSESASESASPSASDAASPAASPADSPSAEEVIEDAPGEESAAEDVEIERQAAAAAPVAQDVVDLSSSSGSSTPMILLAIAIAMAVIAAAWYGVSRRRSATHGPTRE